MAYILMQPSLWIGTGDPNGQLVANRGAAAYRSDGGVGTTLYVKEANDGGNTGWTAVASGGGGPATQLNANGDVLDIDAIADGEFLVRSGTTIVGSAGGGGGLTQAQVLARGLGA